METRVSKCNFQHPKPVHLEMCMLCVSDFHEKVGHSQHAKFVGGNVHIKGDLTFENAHSYSVKIVHFHRI